MNDEKLDLILNELTKLNSRVGGLENKTNDIQTEVKSMKQEFFAKLETLETKSDAIMEQVVKNSEDITMIKDTQKVISDIIIRQEDTVNLLARRSLDQEEAIKRIK